MIGLLIMLAFQATDDNADLRGTVGMCIRWDGPEHIGDAVVVVSSGNPTLDAAMPATVKAMKWNRPNPPYSGGWIGINFAVAGGATDSALPDCTKYELPKR
jgi:uncharacterized NAD(P)/FAD-binding protein YdhS